jgi:hypothetical protein
VVEARRQNLRKNFLTVLLRADKDRVSAGMVPKDENDRIKEFTTMARVNTPKQYKCSVCSELGHNARTCVKRTDGPSATQMMKELRDQKRAAKAAIKAAKAAAKVPYVAVAEPVIVIKPFLAEPVVDDFASTVEILGGIDAVREQIAIAVAHSRADAVLPEPADVPSEEDEQEEVEVALEDMEPSDAELMALEEESEDEAQDLAAFATHDPELAALLASIS